MLWKKKYELPQDVQTTLKELSDYESDEESDNEDVNPEEGNHSSNVTLEEFDDETQT